MTAETVPADNRFPPLIRLRKRSEFINLKNSAQKFASRGVLVVWQDNNLAYARLGVTVSKKVGCAVTRNRIKRFVREVFRTNRALIPAVDMNVIARSESANMNFIVMKQELLKAFNYIGISPCSRVSHS